MRNRKRGLDEEVVRTGAPGPALEALVRIGGVHEHLATELLAGDLPWYLDEEQREYYLLGVKDYVWRTNQDAADVYEAAMRRALEIDHLGASTAVALERLAELRPEAWQLPAEEIPDPQWVTGSRTAKQWER